MKKILTHLTGIVFLFAILVAGGCDNGPAPTSAPPQPALDLDKVTIFVKAVKLNGDWHLEMYDSNYPNKTVIDDLETIVELDTRIVWRRADDSGIKKFRAISPVAPLDIMKDDATTILLNKRKRYTVVDPVADRTKAQKYIIVFVTKEDNQENKIDPYLKFPPN